MIPQDSVGPFVLGPSIGRGGMAVVYSAHHEMDGTPVAIKILHREFAELAQHQEAFGHEVRAAAQLDHPRITTIFDHGVITALEGNASTLTEGAPWLAMELVEGGTIAPECGRIQWPDLRRLLIDVLDGLAHAHARGMVHRDIKPANILLDSHTQRVKVTDFGLAHSIRGDQAGAHSNKDEISGTPSFMSPEQVTGLWRDFGPWTDLYAVGVLAWKLATGSAPYTGKCVEVLVQHVQGLLPKFTPSVSVPRDFLHWIEAMMAVKPHRRFQRAADAAWALAHLDESEMSQVDHSATDEDTTGPTKHAMSAGLNTETLVLDTAVATPLALADSFADSNAGYRDAAISRMVSIRAPIPESWRARKTPRRHLHGAGLALFGLRATGMVGRESERDQLWGGLQAVVETQRPHLILLEGAAGSGKSTLAQWLTMRADELGVAVPLVATHSELGGPSDGDGAMLARHLNIDSLSRKEAVDRVEYLFSIIKAGGRDEAIALVEIASPSEPDATDAEGLAVHFTSPQERHSIIACYLRALSNTRPVVLWIDEIHRDPDALGLVREILSVADSAPILVLGTIQAAEVLEDSETAKSLNALLERDHTARIHLSPLDREGQSTLVRELLGLEPTLAAQVEARSAGNPQFAVQLVADLVHRGLLVASEEGFALMEGANVRMPSDMSEMWAQRLDVVFKDQPTTSIHAIELAAVLGTDVSREEWDAGCSAAGLDIPEGLLSHLMRLRLVVGNENNKDWSFVHGMLREAILAHAKKHDRLISWASTCADTLKGRRLAIAKRARLLLLANRNLEAIAPLRLAVQQQIEMGEYDRAIELSALRESVVDEMGSGQDGPEYLVTQLLRLQCLKKSERYVRIHEVARPLIALAERHEDWSALVSLLYIQGVASVSSGDIKEAHQFLTRGLELANQHKLHHAITLHNSLCFLGLRMGDHATATSHARKAILAGEAHGKSLAVAHGYAMLARVYRQTDELDRAGFCLDEALIRFEALGARYGTAEVYNTRGEVCRAKGDLEGAKRWYTEAAERFRSCGSNAGAFCRLNLGMTCLEGGDFPAAQALFDSVVLEFEALHQVGVLAVTRVFRLCCYAAAQEWKEIESELSEVLPILEQTGLVDLDIGHFARMAAQILDEAGQEQLSKSLWKVALHQWQSLGREDEAKEASQALELNP